MSAYARRRDENYVPAFFPPSPGEEDESPSFQQIEAALLGLSGAVTASEAFAALEQAGLSQPVLEYARRRWRLVERFLGGGESPGCRRARAAGRPPRYRGGGAA